MQRFELRFEWCAVGFTHDVSTGGDPYRAAQRFRDELVSSLRELPRLHAKRGLKRRVYFQDEDEVYLVRDRYLPTVITDRDPAMSLDELLNDAQRDGIPHLFVHTVVERPSLLVSRSSIPFEERLSGRDRIKHIDLLHSRAPLALCAGEMRILSATPDGSQLAAILTNKSGTFFPSGRALARTQAYMAEFYPFRVIIGVDFDNRQISVLPNHYRPGGSQ